MPHAAIDIFFSPPRVAFAAGLAILIFHAMLPPRRAAIFATALLSHYERIVEPPARLPPPPPPPMPPLSLMLFSLRVAVFSPMIFS